MMPYIIVGLGNPGEEYDETRHNVGRMAVENLRVIFDCSEWKTDKKKKISISKGKIGKEGVTLVYPEGFMNNSGASLRPIVSSKKASEKLIVIYDDLDLGFGAMKISWNRGSGGHKGIESIIKSLKTREFIRLRIGISPNTPSGKVRKPKGEERVMKFILGKFKKEELVALKKIFKKIGDCVEVVVLEGKDRAMCEYNS